MENIYFTSEIAQLFEIHPNTIRFYEKCGLMPKVERKKNGYRIFTDKHVQQIKLIRVAFKSEILANNLRKQVVEIVKSSAKEDYKHAINLTKQYRLNLEIEEKNAKEALKITQDLLEHIDLEHKQIIVRNRYSASKYLGITKDVLRDWERNGLLEVPKDSKGHYLYGKQELKRAKIIRTLRNAHYSMMSILRMLNTLDYNAKADILKAIDTPVEDDIISATDRFITTLEQSKKDTEEMIMILNNFN